MRHLLSKHSDKLVAAGLAEPGAPLLGGLDAELEWNREDPARAELGKLFGALSINSLLFCRPAEPYRSLIAWLAETSGGAIRPSDCETRTMLHDIPVAEAFSAPAIAGALRRRKCAVVPGGGVVAQGAVSPEQAFVFFSSVCFASFVKFFADYFADARTGRTTRVQRRVFSAAADRLGDLPADPPSLARGPLGDEAAVRRAMAQAGRETVRMKLVDSFFGNVSFLLGETLFISQTGSSLDELEDCIDACPLDGSSCAAITASSEFTAHREIVQNTDADGVLHGHPKFSVIQSLCCERDDCPDRGRCHVACRARRFAGDIPIVPGEVGAGPTGLSRTLPPAIAGRRGAIVHGHGLFTLARADFNGAFADLLAVERMCREMYFEAVG